MKNSTFSAQVANNLLTLLQGYSKTIRLLLVMFLTLTASTTWGAEVTYTVSSTSAVTKTGTAPAGSNATYTSTYTTKCQLIKDKSMTLTLSGYDGCKITGLTLSMKSNKSAGAGNMSMKIGATTISSIATANFNDATWNGAYSQSYVDVTPSVTATTVGNGQNIVITIAATVNSLYCESFTLTYTSSGGGGGSTPTQLSAPTGLTVGNITSSGATLSWNAVANASSYIVTMVDGASLDQDYPVTGTTKTFDNLNPSTDYLWTVTAVGDGINYTNSEKSVTSEFTTSAAAGGGDGECTWQLVTDASTLKADDEVIITASGENNYALSTNQKSSNREGTAITKSGNTLSEPSADVQVLTLKAGSSTGTWAFYTGNSGYLYAASSSGNQLKTKTTLDVNGSWTISISNGVASIIATGSSNRNVMQYNPNNGSPIFACYASASQTSLAIYKKICSDDGGDDPEPVIVKTLKSIEVTGMTTTFEQGDVFKFNGTCTATYSVTKDGAAQADETAEVTPTSVSTPNMNTIGTQTVTVTYSEGGVEKTAEYQITITENTVTAGEYCITPNNEFWGTNFNGSLSGEALDQTYTGRQDDITIQYAKGSSQYMYINDSQTRVYGNNSLTFSVPSGYVITAIAFTADGTNWKGTHTSNVGTMTDSKNWAGSANEVTITFGNNCRITKICVTYEELDLTLPSAPTFNPEAGTYNTVQNVTISAEAGTTIYYTLDGTDPTTASDVYASAIEISKTTTVKAIAVKDEKVSPVATATYTINLPLTTMDQIFAKATAVGSTATSVEITFGNWVVTGVKGSNAYLTDGTKGLIIYTASHGFVVGDVLSGTVACKVQLYNGSSELTELVKTTEGLTVTTDGTVTPVVVNDVTTLNGVNTGSVIKITGPCTVDGSNYYVAGVQLYNSLFAYTNPEDGYNYECTGIYLQYNTTKEILPRKAEDLVKIVTQQPAGIKFETTEYTANVNEAFTAPTLTNPNGLTVTYSTSDATLATVDATTGAVTILNKTGKVTITASFAGNEDYVEATASYTITISDPNLLEATFVAGTDKSEELSISKNGVTVEFTGGTFSRDDNYRCYANQSMTISYNDGQITKIVLAKSSDNSKTPSNFTTEQGTYAYAGSEGVWTGEAKSVTFETTTQVQMNTITVYYKQDTRQEAGIAWSTESIEITVGKDFTAPTLSNPYSVSGITYKSSNTDVATVTDAGVIALAGATGEATITATFDGDATYKPATATCTIIVNAIPALAAPTGLTVTDLTCSSVTLSWNAVTNATGYEVVRTLNANNTTSTTDEPSITIEGLTGGNENSWKVRAMGDGVNHGNSDYTTGDNFTTLFSVKYYVDEALWHGCDNGCAANDRSYEICETVPTKANYDFAGWATSNGGEVAYQAGGTINNIAANVTLHAVWTLKKYTVTWIADDTETTVQFDHGADLTLPDAPTPCDGMEFVGWTTQRAYIHNTDPLFTEATGTVTSDATYYAVFATQGTSTGETTLDFSTQGYKNAEIVTSLEINGITVTFAKGSATTDATYYDNGTAVRVYKNGTFTIASEESTISKIVLTLTGSETNPITSNTGVYESGTWTGSAKSITFTIGNGDDKYRRIKSITVISEGGASTLTDHTTTCSGITTLDAPQNLAVSNIKYNSATFTWNEVEEARSYFITIGDMTPITTTTNTYTTHDLKAGTAYTWSVKALGNNTNVLHSSVTTGPEFRTYASVTITWVTGGESTTTTTTAGLPLGALKTTTPPDGCSTKTFIGWTTTRSINNDGTDITYITEETVPTKNTTYYAVFAEPQDNGGELGDQLFSESFDTNEGKGGNDDQWNNITTSTEMVKDGWEFTKGYVAFQCIRLGTGSIAGSATTPALGIDGTATLSFNAGAWDGNSETTGINLIIVGEGTIIPSSITLNKGQFDTYTATINGANADTKVRFVAQNASNNRFFLDEVYVHEGSTTTYSDYSTSCGTYFVTFYGFTGYSTTCNGNPAEVEVQQGGSYTIPACTPTTDPQGLGRTFAGTWNTKANGKGTSYSPNQEITHIEDHITLYAQWALNTESNITLPTDVEDLANTDIVVNGGNTLTLQAGTTTIKSLTLKGGLQSNGAYAMPVINIPAGATLVRNSNKINLDLTVNNQSYYPFAVPFEVANTAANVNYINPTLKDYANKNDGYGKYYRILEYNGAGRADNGVHEDNWVHVGRTDVKLIPGKGYAISAVPASGQDTVTIRITMNVDNAWLANGEQESITVKEQTTTRNTVDVTAHTGAAAKEHPRHAGWNFVANPYLANFSANENISGAGYLNGKLLIENGNYSYTTDEVPYVTIPTYNFAHYYQQKLSEATLSPAYGFFVQVGTGGTMSFAVEGRQTAPAGLAARSAEERPVKMDVDITLSDNHRSDATGLIICDRYTDEYEIGRDLEKLFGSANNLTVYTLMADNTPLAYQALAIRSNMQVIPVGYRTPAQGEYTFRLNEATSSIDLLNEQYEQLVLVDYQTGELTNLLISDYTFYSERTQADNRFAIYAVPRQNAPTDLPNAIGQDKQAQKIIHNGHLYILRDGNVYNGNGQIVK